MNLLAFLLQIEQNVLPRAPGRPSQSGLYFLCSTQLFIPAIFPLCDTEQTRLNTVSNYTSLHFFSSFVTKITCFHHTAAINVSHNIRAWYDVGPTWRALAQVWSWWETKHIYTSTFLLLTLIKLRWILVWMNLIYRATEAAASGKVDNKTEPKIFWKLFFFFFCNHRHMNKSWNIMIENHNRCSSTYTSMLDLFFISASGVNDWLMEKIVEINQQWRYFFVVAALILIPWWMSIENISALN